jgi:peptide/nickel transport system permease protein
MDLIHAERVVYSERFRIVRFLVRPPSSAIGFVILLVWAVSSLAAPWLAPYDPVSQDLSSRLMPPSRAHLFGTDDLGRDVLSRVLYGGRVSVPAGFVVVAVSDVFGTLLGSIAGFWDRWLDDVLMRLTDFFFAFPPIILALAIGAAFGPDLSRSILALIIVWWPQYARMARGMVQSLKQRDFVEAARAAGAGDWRVLLRTITPNAMRPVFIMGVLDVANGIVAVALFSFLGLGVRPPTPEWGAMIASGASLMDKWWVSLFPGLAMLVVIIALNLVGDAARDFLAPESF